MLFPFTSLLILTTSFPLPIFAALNGRCTGSKATGEWKSGGICIKTSTCRNYKGTTKNGACPYDPDDVKCCVTDECSGHPGGQLYHSRCGGREIVFVMIWGGGLIVSIPLAFC